MVTCLYNFCVTEKKQIKKLNTYGYYSMFSIENLPCSQSKLSEFKEETLKDIELSVVLIMSCKVHFRFSQFLFNNVHVATSGST